MKYFVISDVHSFYTQMIETLKEKGYDQNNTDHTLILCGDAFDRGPESKEMFKWMKSLPQDRFVYVRGNHEDLLKECYDDIVYYGDVHSHHYSNGTVKTVMDLCQVPKSYSYLLNYDSDIIEKIQGKLRSVLNFIDKKCVDFFETDHFVFVHGWIPCLDDWKKGDWNKARWVNGMHMWADGVKLADKTVVCGHWHSSWGNCHIHGDVDEEFPKNRYDEDKMTEAFKPFIDDGIIAIDGCTAYSGRVNCVVLED